MARTLIILLLFASVPGPLYSQQLSDYQKLEREANLLAKAREVQSIKNQTEHQMAVTEFNVGLMRHNMEILKWQHESSRYIFYLVVAFVIVGLGLSYLEFRRGSGESKSSRTKVEAGAKGFAIDSQVIGLVILFLSLGFFYLYITEIYELKPINLWATQENRPTHLERLPDPNDNDAGTN